MIRAKAEIKLIMVAVTFVIATIVLSCKEQLPAADPIDSNKVPSQIVEKMSFQQTSSGKTVLRVEAPIMQRFGMAKEPYDFFPRGINVKGFTKDGFLETEIRANKAKHTYGTTGEVWMAFGKVVINNYIKGEKMTTDTLYWDRLNKKIYTKCLVKMTTPDLFMQGYGMESDDMARSSQILQPFDSYAIVSRDSLEIPYIDSVNFIGPFPRKKK